VDGRDVKHVLGPALGRTRGHGHDDQEEPSTTLLQPDLLNRTAVDLSRQSMDCRYLTLFRHPDVNGDRHFYNANRATGQASHGPAEQVRG
jgi:hypothetical protein